VQAQAEIYPLLNLYIENPCLCKKKVRLTFLDGNNVSPEMKRIFYLRINILLKERVIFIINSKQIKI